MNNYGLNIGDRIGRFVIVEFIGEGRWCLAKCDCGNTKRVRVHSLVTGHTKSCGCFARDRVTTHGMFGSTEYRSWQGMKSRCQLPHNATYRNYGARGIYVCDRWRNSFEAFLEDMGPKPSQTHSIERRDNNGPYSPENCFWATPKMQGNNTRKNRMITCYGETKTLSQWADEVTVSASAIRLRLNRGWTPERALFTPPRG